MCNYCGCREFPLVGLLTEQHVEIEEMAGRLRRAIVEGREAAAEVLLDRLVALLIPHTAIEEDGLFAELRAEGTHADAIDRLCAEHQDIDGVLGAARRAVTVNRVPADPAAPDWTAVLAALVRLRQHIDNEEHGLFPTAVIALPIQTWDRITAVVPAA